MRVFGEFAKGINARVRVTTQDFRGTRLDIREFYLPEGAEDLHPTRRGISVPVGRIPALRFALEQAEDAARREGLLTAADYAAAGLSLPGA
jgi:hypothetical protein